MLTRIQLIRGSCPRMSFECERGRSLKTKRLSKRLSMLSNLYWCLLKRLKIRVEQGMSVNGKSIINLFSKSMCLRASVPCHQSASESSQINNNLFTIKSAILKTHNTRRMTKSTRSWNKCYLVRIWLMTFSKKEIWSGSLNLKTLTWCKPWAKI